MNWAHWVISPSVGLLSRQARRGDSGTTVGDLRTRVRAARNLNSREPHHRHRRPAQRRQEHPLQRPDQERRARGELPVRHDRAQHRRGGRARPAAGEAGRGVRLARRSSRRRSPSWTSPASSAAPARAQGLGNKFLANIRESDAICQVIRVFTDPDVVHVDGKVSPSRRHRDDQHRADPGRPADPREGDPAAGEGDCARTRSARRCTRPPSTRRRCSTPGRHSVCRGRRLPAPTCGELRALLTTKPFLYVFNVDEDELANEELSAELRALVAPAEAIFMDAKIESELAELPAEEAAELLSRIGQDEPGLDQLARVGLRDARPADLPDRRAQGGARLDHPGRAPPPRRPPASSTPTSSAASSRPRSSPSTT